MGPFICKEENSTRTPAWPAAHTGCPAQHHSHCHPSGPLLLTKMCPEASLHPTNLQGHEEADTGCELGQVGSHGWATALPAQQEWTPTGAVVPAQPSLCHAQFQADPQHKATSPRVPGVRSGGAKHVPRACARTAGLT